MKTCKDCLHYDVCQYHIDEETDMRVDDGVCNNFTDRSEWAHLPCKVGDTVFTNLRVVGDYLRVTDAPYAAKVIFIGLNNSKEMGYGFINIEYTKTERQVQFYFSDIGTKAFLTREEAEEVLERMKENEKRNDKH